MKRTTTLAALAAVALGVAVAPANAAGVSAIDEHYLTTAISGDQFEITGAQIALRKSHNAAVRRLARTLVRDHLKSRAETTALAMRLGVKPPNAAEPPQQWELAVTGAMSGRGFDRWYSALEIADHKQDIADALEEAANGHAKEVRKDAYKEVPDLRMHLALARAAWARS